MSIRLITLFVLMAITSSLLAQQVPSSQDYMQAAQDALQGNDYTTAIQDYLFAIKADPKNWEAYQNLGGCYIQLRKMDDAKAAYDESLKINPNNPALVKFMSQVWGGKITPLPTPIPVVPTPTVVIVLPVVTPVATPMFTPTYQYTVVSAPSPQVSGTPTPVPVNIPLGEIETPVPAGKQNQNEVIRPPFAGKKPYMFQALPRYNLPDKNSITFEFGAAGWFGNIQNFNDYFGSSLTPAASSHTGLELDLGADYAIINEIQLGLHLEGITSPVDNAQLGSQFVEWDSYALGLAAAGKYLIPLNSAMSMIFHLEAGYYSLVGSQIIYNKGAAGSVALSGSTIGFTPSIEMEFFQVADKSLALDFGLGYRFLDFTSLTGTGTVNGTPISGALINPGNGKPAYDDYSGPRVSFSIRFVH